MSIQDGKEPVSEVNFPLDSPLLSTRRFILRVVSSIRPKKEFDSDEEVPAPPNLNILPPSTQDVDEDSIKNRES